MDTLQRFWPLIVFTMLLFIVEGAVRYYFSPLLEARGWQYLERWLRLVLGGVLVWAIDLNVFVAIRSAFDLERALPNTDRLQAVGLILTAVLIGLGSQGTAVIVAQVRGVWTKYLKDLPATLKNGLNGKKSNDDEE